MHDILGIQFHCAGLKKIAFSHIVSVTYYRAFIIIYTQKILVLLTKLQIDIGPLLLFLY